MANETSLYLRTILTAAGIAYDSSLSQGQLRRLAVAKRLIIDDTTIPTTTTATTTTSVKGDKGDPGSQGAQGAQGIQGSDGSDGADGEDGKTLLNGAGTPASGLGVDGDFYIDTTGDDIYGPKTLGSWGSGTSIIGPQGPTGGSGSGGSQIDVGPLVVTSNQDSIVVFGSLVT